MKWLKDLDELLRGRKTDLEALAQGTDHLRLSSSVAATLVLALAYGVFMGLYAVINHTPPTWEQWLATAAKLPFVFFFTLVVTFPSLYVFSALLGSPLSLRGTLRLVTASQAINLVVLASLGPIIGFFALTTGSYPFIKLLNVLFFIVAGFIGLGFLVKVLKRLQIVRRRAADQAVMSDVKPGEPPEHGDCIADLQIPIKTLRVELEVSVSQLR